MIRGMLAVVQKLRCGGLQIAVLRRWQPEG